VEERKKNFFGFVWHGVFLAFTMAFVEVNTVLPAMILKAGGGNFAIGVVTAISTGIPLVAQLFFGGVLHARPRKRPFLLLGIWMRVTALFSIGLILGSSISGASLLVLVFAILSVFSFSGAFAGISYTDLLGKAVFREDRKRFMVFRQIAGSVLSLLGGVIARTIVGNVEYPSNYSWMFFIAATSLAIASVGFLAVSEKRVENIAHQRFLSILKQIPSTLKRCSNLRNYILFTNSTGFGLILIPFYVLLARTSFGLRGEDVGNFLLFQMVGMLGAGFFWNFFLQRRGLKNLLKLCVRIGGVLPLLALLLSHTTPLLFSLLFLFSGLTLSARKMSFEWLLIEITESDNRALFTGISGALNLVTALFPLLLGPLITVLGFLPVFVAAAIFVFLGNFFLDRIELD